MEGGGGGGGKGRRLGHPDPEIRGAVSKFFFWPFGPQFDLKIRGGPRSPAPALDPPQFKASHTCFEVGFFLLISKRTSTGYLHDVVTCRSRRWLVVVEIYRGREAARYIYTTTSDQH